MSTINKILGNAAAPHRLEYNGKHYDVRLIDQATQGAFARRLFEKARESLEVLKPSYSEEKYEQRLTELGRAYEDGEYDMLSPRGKEHLEKPAGIQMLLGLLIDCQPEELYGILLAKKTEIRALLSVIIKESFPGVTIKAKKAEAAEASAVPTGAREGADPNPPRPARQTRGSK